MTPAELPATIEFRSINGMQLECAIAGERGQPLVILLHGFPDVWQGWHLQIAPLVAAGYRVVAPNQRGYGKSDKPRGASAYDLDLLAEDVRALADSEGADRFHVVGHDWGGIIAWWVAAQFPKRVAQLVSLNAPHPGVFFPYLLRHPTQWLKSWYIGFFQLPWLPEALLSRNNYRPLFRGVVGTSQPGVFDESDRSLLVANWSEPGALTAMLNYYRAVVRRSSRTLQRRIEPPTLIVMSDRDPALEPGLATASLALCERGQIAWLPGAAHWVQREEADQVTKLLIEFLQASSGGSG